MMNAGQAIQTAIASYESAISLNNTIQSTVGDSQAPPPAQLLRRRALVQVVVIMTSFAIEMGLKAIMSKERVSFRKIHDLRALYDRVPDRIRLHIDDVARREGVSMNGVCEAHSNSFTDWRYAADERQSGAFHADPYALLNAAFAAIHVYESRYGEQHLEPPQPEDTEEHLQSHVDYLNRVRIRPRGSPRMAGVALDGFDADK